jgi:hypothetical protein
MSDDYEYVDRVQNAKAGTALDVVCHGLKPLTQHTFYDAGVDMTINCIQIAGVTLGAPVSSGVGGTLISDASGQIHFTYHLTITDSIKNNSTKLFEIKALNSYAQRIVTFIQTQPQPDDRNVRNNGGSGSHEGTYGSGGWSRSDGPGSRPF